MVERLIWDQEVFTGSNPVTPTTKQEERFEIGLWCSPLSAAWDKKVKCADQFGTVWTINQVAHGFWFLAPLLETAHEG